MTEMRRQPFVSVVTPVYNGAQFLTECIESVLAQTHGEFEHIILDNASTDGTASIAAEFARLDARIQIHRNERTLYVIDNWNRTLEKISPESQFCKILHADDTLHPDCLEKMVRLAQHHPSVGAVGSLRLRGDRVECRGLPVGREVFDGGEIARLFLRKEVFAFAPSCGMIRSDLVRAHAPFYPPGYLHADLAAYFELLAEYDFGYLDEVLCFSRTHAGSITTTVAQRKETLLKEWLTMLREYGPAFFDAEELAELERDHLRRYYRLLVRGVITRRGRDFMHYHWEGLKEARRLPGVGDLCAAAAAEAAASLRRPRTFLRHLRATPTR